MSQPVGGDRWALRVVLAGPDGCDRPAEVDAAADARVGDLLDATGAAAVRGPDGDLLGAHVPLSSAGIRHGDAVELLGEGDDHGDGIERSVVELVCAELHATWTLAPGRHSVGRRQGNAVTIDHPSVSRSHATIVVDRDPAPDPDPDGWRLVIADHGSTNGTFIDGREVRTTTRHHTGATLRLGDVEVEVRPRVRRHGAVHRSPVDRAAELGWIDVPRPPRRAHAFSPVELDAPELPAEVARPRIGWLSALVPVALAVVVVGVSLVVAPGSFGGAYLWLTVAFLMMSPAMTLAGHVEARRTWRRDRRAELARFDEDLAALSAAVDDAIAEEIRHRVTAHPDPDDARRRAEHLDERLWEGPPAERHVAVRLGSAPGTSSVTVRSERSGDRAARRRVEELAARARSLGDVPLAIETPRIVGLVGAGSSTAGVAAAWALSAATNVAPSRRIIDVVVADAGSDRWTWTGWLDAFGPRRSSEHRAVGGPGRGRVRVRGASDPSTVAALVTALLADGAAAVEPGRLHLAIVDVDPLAAGQVAAITATAVDAGVTLVWRARHRSSLPRGCDVVVEVPADSLAEGPAAHRDPVDELSRVTFPAEGRSLAARIDRIEPAVADRWARALAPLAEAVPAAARAGAVPDEVALADVVGDEVLLGDEHAAAQRWARSVAGVEVVLGRAAEGPVRLDLRRAGPHAIVAGTTGSGKSELLRTLVVSAATNHPPERVQFLLIDYKGGAAFGACADLPHVAGFVTDLDEGLAERVVVSLRAELRRREGLLAASGHASLADAEVERDGDAPFANLLVVVDEFASIAAEVPGFLDGVLDLARRGRSLGMHLVLATQRPTGVVSDHLRANASLRIALRVADPQDGVDVVGVADAASFRVDVPGRAMVRVGDEPPATFQVAHCGARRAAPPAPPTGRRQRRPRPVVVRPLGGDGAAAASDAPSPSLADATDLERVVATLAAAHRQRAIAAPPPPWLPPLPDAVALESLLAGGERSRDDATDVLVAVGVADEPDRQSQHAVTVDLTATGPVAVVGGAWAGDVVRSMAVSAIVGRSPTHVRLDVIDGSAGLRWRGVEEFPQVGSVVGVDDHERVRRLLGELERSCGRRVEGGAHADAPARVVVVDNVGAFVAAADRAAPGVVDRLARLVADGASSGVHVIASADRRMAVPSMMWGAFGAVAVGAMASVEEFDACAFGARRPPGVAGRVVLGGVEVQCATIGDGAIGRLAAADGGRYGAVAAAPIGRLPTEVGFAEVVARDRSGAADGRGAGRVLVGIDDDLGPFSLDLGLGNVVVAGPMGSGRSNALAAVAAGLRHATAGRCRAIFVAGRATATVPDGPWDTVISGPDAVEQVDGAVARLAARARRWTPLDPVVFVDDATDLDDALDAALDRLAAVAVDGPVRLVVAVEAALARQSYGGLVARLRRGRRAILLQPDVEVDGDLAGVRLPRRGPGAVPPGRGEWVDRGAVRRVQVARIGNTAAGG